MSPDSELPQLTNGEGPPSASPSRHPSISLQAAATLNAGLQRESPGGGTSSKKQSEDLALTHSPGSPSSPLSPRNRSPSAGRRRSQVLMNLQMADPSTPAPGEMVSDSQNRSHRSSSPAPMTGSPRLIATRTPNHNRAPSLGELHQELENEQEFQVNRLLAQIRYLQERMSRRGIFFFFSPGSGGSCLTRIGLLTLCRRASTPTAAATTTTTAEYVCGCR